MDLSTVAQFNLGQKLGQLRARAVSLGEGRSPGVLVVYGADFDVDPYAEMFFFPTDTLKLALLTVEGELLWKRDLGPGVVPGQWFCPLCAFDLDGNGVDEIWFVNNVNSAHPLGLSGYRLERLDALTGETTGQWPWPCRNHYQPLSELFRNFILGGRVHDEPVLVTAQGTYGDMFFQAWRPDMQPRWEHQVAKTDGGARGSHMAPVVDLNDDGVDELLWGERCIELDTGTELFCADRDTWAGHSDVIWPFRDDASGRYFIFTTRESGTGKTNWPRVALYDDMGRRVWGDLEYGHMDMGWVARLGEDRRHVAMAIRIGHKTCGADGRHHFNREEFVYDALTGAPVELPFEVYGTRPVDLDNDGYDELVRGIPGGDGRVIDRFGNEIGDVGGPVALIGSFCDLPGEQILSYHEDGHVRIWADGQASA